jgi:hypothetical protein
VGSEALLERGQLLSPASVLDLADEQGLLSLLAQGLPFSFLPLLLAPVGQERAWCLQTTPMLLFEEFPSGILLLALGLGPLPLAS